ncbi:MAG: outer membrane protein assembly factor BamB [Gammaproteobacteria bacterium]|nr:outer membrane protein assembly factor BamB [Gammaproteobacteria bacterium]
MSRLWLAPLLSILLTGCSMFGAKDNADPPAELVEFEESLEVEILWDLSVSSSDEKFLAIRPIVRDGKLYIADPDGDVAAVDAMNGEVIWEKDLDTELTGGPGLVGDQLLLGTGEAELLALDAQSGEERWRRRVSSEVLSVPGGESGIVVVRTTDGRVLGVNAGTGESRWNFDRSVPVLTLRGNGSPVVNYSQVFVGFANGKLACLALESGSLIWEAAISIPGGRTELERVVDIDADPVLVEDTIYAGSFQGGVAAVSANSGVVLWKRELSTHAGLDASWRDVYVSDAEDHIWALDATNGATLWQQQTLHARRLSAPTIVGDYLVVGDLEGYLHWLSRDDGRMLARIRPGRDGIHTKPLVVDGVVYVFDRNGRVTALQAKPISD